MLTAENIAFSYGGAPVLRSFSLSAAPGECVVIAGANGCGKSTALSILAGILRPASGTLQRDGSVGYVPQRPALLEDLSAAGNLRFFAGLGGKKPPAAPVMGVQAFLKKRVSRLSGGMKKRLSIACALAQEPWVLLLDEPCEALDAPGRAELQALLQYLKSVGLTVIYVGHDVEEFSDLYDRLVFLRDGLSRSFERAELSGGGSREDQTSRLSRAFAQLFR